MAFSQVNVLTYHNDNARTGQNLNETILTPANVNSTNFGKLCSYAVDGYVYAQPLYVSNVPIPGQGSHNVIFVATEHDSVYAFDADSNTGPGQGLIWRTNLGISAITPNNDFGNRYQLYPDIRPEVGITGTPVIDPVAGTLFVDAFTHEGATYFHRLHALNLATGAEQPGSPVIVSASVPGSGVGSSGGRQVFTHAQQLQRSALTLTGGILYVTYSGIGDTDPYHGWIIGFNPTNLQQLTNYVFNTSPNSTTNAYGAHAGEAGIWMGGDGPAIDSQTNLYVAVGNGIFNATNNSGGTEYGDSFLRLSTANHLSVADYFTPYDQFNLQANDQDLGSGGVMLLPDQPGPLAHLMVGGGKNGRIYLINRDQMSTGNNHFDATNTVDYVVQTLSGQVASSFSTPCWFNGAVYYAGNGDKLKAFAVTNGLLSSTPVSIGSRTFGFPGATPSVSANGTNQGIIWALQTGTPGVLVAYDATNLTNELYNSTQAPGNRDRFTSGVKYVVPTVANGKAYVGGKYMLSIFGLLAGTNAFLPATDYAMSGTGILGTKNNVNSGVETPVFHAGVAGSINDGDLSTSVDTFNGTGTDTASYVGIVWTQPVPRPVLTLELSLATFFDGGWFGVNNSGPGAGGALSATNLIEPLTQISTNGGTSWTTVAHTSDYLSMLTGHALPIIASQPPTLATAHFQLTPPQTGVTGVRLIGSEGGTASGGFLGVFELAVKSGFPQPVQLLNLQATGGQFQFEFDSLAGVTHAVQFKTSVTDTWQTLLTFVGDGSRKRVTDNLSNTLCLYRVTSQ